MRVVNMITIPFLLFANVASVLSFTFSPSDASTHLKRSVGRQSMVNNDVEVPMYTYPFVSPDIGAKAMDEVRTNKPYSTGRSRVAILLCPAQFCVPLDYKDFFDDLKNLSDENLDLPEIGTCQVAPLPRTEWIKVAKKLPTPAFFRAQLDVASTLDWYFEAIERGLTEILSAEGSETRICFIGHSIGGWVARAYLGGLSRSSTAVHRWALAHTTSLITLGTPHQSPETALVDQTRGLLREIAQTPSCKAEALAAKGIDITCVASSGLSGSFVTTDLEELVAATSYLPLLGRTTPQVKGDGIVPLDLAFLEEPARRVVIDACPETGENVRHSHVLPTPWQLLDGEKPSIRVPASTPSYLSPAVVPLWAKFIK